MKLKEKLRQGRKNRQIGNEKSSLSATGENENHHGRDHHDHQYFALTEKHT